MRVYKKNVALFAVVLFLVGVTWVAVLTGPDMSQEQLLETRLSELRDRLQFANALNQERENDIMALRKQFHILRKQLYNLLPHNGTGLGSVATLLPLEVRQLLGNLSYSNSDIQPPSIFHVLPHLVGHPEGLQPAFKLSQDRVGVSIVIGIPTIKRDKVSYLHETLRSVIDGLNEEEKESTLIVVFVAEPLDIQYVLEQASDLKKYFPAAVKSGLLELISPPAPFYPHFDSIKLSLGDPKERVRWRTKQNLDYAFLMMYARSRGTYYCQLEDDVITKPGFASVMKNFALNQKTEDWFILEFSLLGFIGKLFKSSDLPLVVEFFLMFYKDKPIDWLLEHLLYVKTCNPEKDATHCERMKSEIRIRYKPSLFQHIGLKSSLRGKVQKLKDRSFGKMALHRAYNNPSAEVSTTLLVYQKYSIDRAYRGETFFWGLLPHPDDTVNIKFQPPIEIEKFFLKSGNREHPGDQFFNTTIEILPLAHVDKQAGVLTNSDSQEDYQITGDGYLIVGNFTGGVAYGIVSKNVGLVSQLRLHVQKESQNWVVLSEIYIKPRAMSTSTSITKKKVSPS
ncbi:alpha-1,3-mannosyl-glycoprotein 4-beta-N-acetylglucosaminyltransferase B-like [Lineus longissimus]|uniref:alpha-1,3-mannosyl-glycoprotein 4-beta-N-acetylglucosaminyltransferase B-like n=1 Tax=Lineus longissimus TaxID=88925 RepID=UPI002B4F5B65